MSAIIYDLYVLEVLVMFFALVDVEVLSVS